MSHKLRISDITIGGNAVNNPVPLALSNYKLTAAELSFSYRQIDVIAFHTVERVNLHVTGLVEVNPVTDQPKLEASDPVYLPCPPFCYQSV